MLMTDHMLMKRIFCPVFPAGPFPVPLNLYVRAGRCVLSSWTCDSVRRPRAPGSLFRLFRRSPDRASAFTTHPVPGHV